MSQDYNTDFRNLQQFYFYVEGATVKDPVTEVPVQNEKVEPLPRVKIGLEPSEINVFLSKDVTKVVTDADEQSNLIIGRAGPRINHQAFKTCPNLDTHRHVPFIVWVDRPRRKPRAIIFWKHPHESLKVRSELIQKLF